MSNAVFAEGSSTDRLAQKWARLVTWWDTTLGHLFTGNGVTLGGFNLFNPTEIVDPILTDTVLTEAHRTVEIDASSGSVDVELPDTPKKGTLKRIACLDDTNGATFSPGGTNTIGGDTGANDIYAGESLTLIFDGTSNWIAL